MKRRAIVRVLWWNWPLLCCSENDYPRIPELRENKKIRCILNTFRSNTIVVSWINAWKYRACLFNVTKTFIFARKSLSNCVTFELCFAYDFEWYWVLYCRKKNKIISLLHILCKKHKRFGSTGRFVCSRKLSIRVYYILSSQTVETKKLLINNWTQ